MKLRDQMPELNGATKWLNSAPITRAELLDDRPTLFHFWSVSCSLCKDAMPNVSKFRDKYKDELHVIAVHMPRLKKDLDIKQIMKVAQEQGITQPIFIDNRHKLTDAFDNRYVPAYYLFDKDGKLRHFQSGGGGMSMLRKRLNRVLGLSNK
ncbi:TlpA family protein disulfide reductase [Virgibacillus halophilus]|uniref:Redoxin domain-containing protein n=1 Tax=Tigheibacillus halophilus TaxID=361280 RepID=A0ABU5CB24_9BACI|nr:redoxin domain-containing protein [Virgibacillus halophilus]